MNKVYFGAWNVRGLNALSPGERSIKGEAASHYCLTNSVSLFGMLETKVSLDREEEIKRSLPMNWAHCTNGHLVTPGRIWVMWNPDMFVMSLLRCTAHVMTCSIVSVDGLISFNISCVYEK